MVHAIFLLVLENFRSVINSQKKKFIFSSLCRQKKRQRIHWRTFSDMTWYGFANWLQIAAVITYRTFPFSQPNLFSCVRRISAAIFSLFQLNIFEKCQQNNGACQMSFWYFFNSYHDNANQLWLISQFSFFLIRLTDISEFTRLLIFRKICLLKKWNLITNWRKKNAFSSCFWKFMHEKETAIIEQRNKNERYFSLETNNLSN